MRKAILYIALSLDGYIADRHGKVDWLKGDGSDPKASGNYPDFCKDVDTILMGWNTYHQIITDLSPGAWPYGKVTTYVLTHKKLEDQENIMFRQADNMVSMLKDLKAKPGKNIWICSGASMAQELLQEEMVDQFCFSIYPVALGGGKRLMPLKNEKICLKLVKSTEYNGIVDLVYEKA